MTSSRLPLALAALGLAACAADKAPYDPSAADDQTLDGKADATTNRTHLQGVACPGADTAGRFVARGFVGYTFTAESRLTVDIALRATDGVSDPVVMLYGPRKASGGWPRRLAWNDDADGLDSRIAGLRLPAAGTYLIVAGEYDRAAGDFALRLDASGPTADPECAPAPAATLSLVSARDHIDGYFTSPRTIAADAAHVYLASRGNGKLFVLARDRAANFPVVQTIVEDGAPLDSVSVDDQHVYVTTTAGRLRVYAKGATLTKVEERALAPRGFSEDTAWYGGQALVADGSAKVALSGRYAFVAPLNEGDAADVVRLSDDAITAHFAPPLDTTHVVAFDRATGAQVAALTGPLDVYGNRGQSTVYADDAHVALFVPGCCGSGVTLYDAATLAPRGDVVRSWIDAVAFRGDTLVLGDEDGSVEAWDVSGAPRQLARADLRTLTGHTGVEDIEIRAIWADGLDDLVFAGSSWGNDQSRSLDLPSFFVLSLQP